MPLIELIDVVKRYKIGEQEILALDGIDLTIDQGEYAAIIGPSGSGKSTLMHLLGCLDTPTSGTMLIDGIDVSRASGNKLSEMRNQKIGFVFQSFNLLPKLTVLQNVELPMIYAGVSARERRERAMVAIERVELQNRVKNTPLQLSGGQMQRVAIARALVNNPRIIFADEPTGNLDSRTGANILQLFRELSTGGCTIVLVTHDAKIAAQTPRRIEIRDGKIVDSESMDPLLSGQAQLTPTK
ncbi:ABC transporter-related protein [Chthoniobacter flavus Ellin428]|uniref:ABC transporter-related protein n=1 Tax=Chthoniobacter flavus Ellin428 TaxID=497964 RepID=B4D910_9BACT|nr:ABC transporter ATP-binding protein [Chthoniobacter flavus]EDY17055.1 ABC transporter-related protein [Chthoniobacter flavus Ellin428]TCO86180.1 putative ABC transport system ATP-binding protein [Chthoniobacter flavus]